MAAKKPTLKITIRASKGAKGKKVGGKKAASKRSPSGSEYPKGNFGGGKMRDRGKC